MQMLKEFFPVRYQILNINEKVSATPVSSSYKIEIDRKFKHIVAIGFIVRQGAGVDNYLTISDNLKTRFDKAPIKLFSKSLRDLSKNNVFLPVNIPASRNIISILLSAETITTAYDMDIVFVLSNKKREISTYNFQSQQIVVPTGMVGKWVSDVIYLDSSFDKVVGFLISKDLTKNAKIGIKDSSGNYIVDPLDSRMIEPNTTDILPFDETFFPVLFESGQEIRCEVEPLTALIADLKIETIFLLKTDK